MSDKVYEIKDISGIFFGSGNTDPLGLVSLEVDGDIYINQDGNLILLTFTDVVYTVDDLLQFQSINFIPDNSDLIKDEYGHIINLKIERQYLLTRCDHSTTYIGYDKAVKNPIVIVNN